jgi:hypothetical protein
MCIGVLVSIDRRPFLLYRIPVSVIGMYSAMKHWLRELEKARAKPSGYSSIVVGRASKN